MKALSRNNKNQGFTPSARVVGRDDGKRRTLRSVGSRVIVAAHIGECGRRRAAEVPRVIARREEGGIWLERAVEGVFAWPDVEIRGC